MKKLLLILSLFIITLSAGYSQSTPRVVDSKDFAVLVNAKAESSPTPKITITWNKAEQALSYYIYRKEVADEGFNETFIAKVDSSVTFFVDTKVKIGIAYEYEIRSFCLGAVSQDGQNIPFNYYGFGYICAGIEIPEINSYGKVLVLVDETMIDGLSSEITQLKEDLKEEGWNVVLQKVPRVDVFDGAKVKEVKALIKEEWAKDKANFKAIYLLGRVPVPYSGRLNPDGHGDHIGAWPADVYYGFMDGETNWTDSQINDVSASRTENKNVPGDGKFDVTTSNFYKQKIPVGRVDFYNMAQCYDTTKVNPEMELIRQYLIKAHNYRNGLLNVQSRGILSVNFSPSSDLYYEFGSSGWRNLAALVGKDNLFYADILKTISTDSYLWTYGCGGGWYQGAGGVGDSKQISSQQMNTVFTMLFGSYFGDWDSPNNFMRAALASMPSALTCAWAGRPHWFFHHLGINYPIGYSQLLTQNNYDTYKPLLACTTQYPDGQIITYGNRMVHIALMGDPTLRMFSASVVPPSNLTGTINNEGKIELNWTEPPTGGASQIKYNVFRSLTKYGIYEKINTTDVTTPQYIDDFKYDGTVYYEVRTVMLSESNTASFYNTSRGIFTEILLTDVNDNTILSKELTAYPNPAVNEIEIGFNVTKSGNYKIQIFDLHGNLFSTIFDNYAGNGEYKFKYDLKDKSGNKLNSGVYLIKMSGAEKTTVQKLIVNK
jgi:hypothetical protein